MSTPTDTYRYLITVNGYEFIYHSATPMSTEEQGALVIELENTSEDESEGLL